MRGPHPGRTREGAKEVALEVDERVFELNTHGSYMYIREVLRVSGSVSTRTSQQSLMACSDGYTTVKTLQQSDIIVTIDHPEHWTKHIARCHH
jgi:hypothetical protein